MSSASHLLPQKAARACPQTIYLVVSAQRLEVVHAMHLQARLRIRLVRELCNRRRERRRKVSRRRSISVCVGGGGRGGWWARVEWADTRASRPRTNLPVTDTARQRAKRPVKAMVATAFSLYVAECIVPLARLASPLRRTPWRPSVGLRGPARGSALFPRNFRGTFPGKFPGIFIFMVRFPSAPRRRQHFSRPSRVEIPF